MSPSFQVTGVDFASAPTRDLAGAVHFYGHTLGLPLSVHFHDFAEFDVGNLTLNVYDAEAMGLEFAPNPNLCALHVADVSAAREELEAAGVEFPAGMIDTGVCHMAPFKDPDGNGLMLHHRYAPRVVMGD